MSPELDEQLCKKYPLLYSDRNVSMQHTCMCWGFCCGDGWFSIIDELSAKLEVLIQNYVNEIGDSIVCRWCGATKDKCGTPQPNKYAPEGVYTCHSPDGFEPNFPRAVQVKEKFGTLRFYMTSGSPEMYDEIRKAEELALTTCETCGQPAKPKGMACLCKDCSKPKRKK